MEQALKQRKREFRDTGMQKRSRDRKEFVKPSVMKRRQKQKAKYIQKRSDQESD